MMTWEFRTITVWRRYRNRERDYFWESEDDGGLVTGWDEILAIEAKNGWELVSVCVDGYEDNNTSTEATGYRLFLKRAGRSG